MSKIFGIDISSWQKGFNLSTAKNQGVKFTILRAGYTGSSDGVSKAVDKCFEEFYKKCKEINMPVGAYWFSRATTYDKGKAEAEYMYEKCLKNKKFEYPIYIDVEDTTYQNKVGKNAITSAIKGFCEYLEKKGYYVGIYASKYWFNNKMNINDLKQYDKWIACWTKEEPTGITYGLWQFGGETNSIRSNKVAGMVCDQNYSFKDYSSIIKNKGLNGFAKVNATSNASSTPTTQKTSANTVQNSTQKTNISTSTKKIYHKVIKGDTLSKIALKYKITVSKIVSLNNIKNPNVIYVGQNIRVK